MPGTWCSTVLAICIIIINMFARVSPTNDVLHLQSISYVLADTVLDGRHVPSIILPISKMRKLSLKEVRTQRCPGQSVPQLDRAWVLTPLRG